VAIGRRWKSGISTPGEFYAGRIGGNQEVVRVASFGWLKTIAAAAEGATSGDPQGWVDVYFCCRGRQLGADAESAFTDSSNRVSRGRSAPRNAK
jgi:hypothetical protein